MVLPRRRLADWHAEISYPYSLLESIQEKRTKLHSLKKTKIPATTCPDSAKGDRNRFHFWATCPTENIHNRSSMLNKYRKDHFPKVQPMPNTFHHAHDMPFRSCLRFDHAHAWTYIFSFRSPIRKCASHFCGAQFAHEDRAMQTTPQKSNYIIKSLLLLFTRMLFGMRFGDMDYEDGDRTYENTP